MRLYRGLKNSYRPELVDESWRSGSDFTDCPAVALSYAQGSRGVLVVVDIEASRPRTLSEASWPQREAKRFIIWGRFDEHLVVVFQAKDLRARLRREGHRNSVQSTKAHVLRAVMDDELRLQALRSTLDLRSEVVGRVSLHE